MRKAALFAIATFLLITGMWLGMTLDRANPVCHATQEDSVILDCDYHNGAWYRK